MIADTVAHHDLVSAAADVGPRPRLRLLLDSNVVLAAEPYAGQLEANLVHAAELLRLANELGHVLCVAPATRDDILEGTDQLRRQQRLQELKKFSQLEEVPISDALEQRAGPSVPGTNDHRDLRLLAALDAHAVHYLITEDKPFYKRCVRAGHGDHVLNLAGALELLRSFIRPNQTMPPRVRRVPAYALDTQDPIFASLREDYPDFDAWLDKVRADSENRTCLLIEGEPGYAALALLKDEADCDFALPGPVMKVSTLKVSANHGQSKLGELLLKAIFSEAHDRGAAALYVTVFDKHQSLIALLANFGFKDLAVTTGLGEHVLAKRFADDDATSELDDLDFHIKYGPPALRAQQSGFVVPIKRIWHDQLFPELMNTEQLDLYPGLLTHPWGNALRKAYICNSSTTGIARGDLVLFYRSQGLSRVCVVGIVEDAVRSTDPVEISTLVGIRTVYTFDEIADMCGRVRGALAITFRQDRFLEPELELAELKLAGVLKAHPQQIQRIPEGGMTWLRERLTESP